MFFHSLNERPTDAHPKYFHSFSYINFEPRCRGRLRRSCGYAGCGLVEHLRGNTWMTDAEVDAEEKEIWGGKKSIKVPGVI